MNLNNSILETFFCDVLLVLKILVFLHTTLQLPVFPPAVAGEDFVNVTSLLVPISASDFGTQVCENISTVADAIVEATEIFSVSVISTDAPSSILSVDPATAIEIAAIIDNSSEFTLQWCLLLSF